MRPGNHQHFHVKTAQRLSSLESVLERVGSTQLLLNTSRSQPVTFRGVITIWEPRREMTTTLWLLKRTVTNNFHSNPSLFVLLRQGFSVKQLWQLWLS